nr:broad-complex core protein-like [Penaeus vannamei]
MLKGWKTGFCAGAGGRGRVAPERKSGPLLPRGTTAGGDTLGPHTPGSTPPTHHRLSPFADLRCGAAARAPPRGEGARGRPQPSSGLASAVAAGDEACVCPYCGKSLRDKYKVRRHIEDVHTPSSHSHQCSLCHRHYKTRNTLQNHMSIYTARSGGRTSPTTYSRPPPLCPQDPRMPPSRLCRRRPRTLRT